MAPQAGQIHRENLTVPESRLQPLREMGVFGLSVPERFGVSRPSLREASQKLVAKGLLVSRQGGGNYVAEGLGAQVEQCLANVDAGLRGAGMGRADVVKLTFYLTVGTPEAIATYRACRDAWTGDVIPPASTLLIVAGLASPALLAEVDCVAAR